MEAFHKRPDQDGNGIQLEKVGSKFSNNSIVPLDKVDDNSSNICVIRIDFDKGCLMEIILVTRAATSTNV